ncbi:MAG: polysaccharide biosynthesis/export family protein [Edaphobacter sp.]|uniref:polysaccharide biosynthesis/export family protein n=1 Tax=Edaphobacter sp. TaxID=1934404 RepID=UPI0023A5CF79|nr:polysaccharide biosynthesis/export family protein [Edaphobacter sp.]MDE1178113.1 polysaccharide biosynthesis/export family protein [Edaphobacter sp.]
MFQWQTGPESFGQIETGRRRPLAQAGQSLARSRYLGLVLAVALCATGLSASAQTTENKQAPAATAPAPLSGSSAGAGVDPTRYIIGSEDTLQITVWKEPTLSGTVPVRPDGRISLVLVGDLPASGRTPMQLADDITTRLKKYIQDPNVSVIVMAVGSQKIFLVGEVGHVGPVMLSAGMSALQAIAAGGGLTPYANSKKIYILRNQAGKQEKIPFNYKEALKGALQGPELKPGDTIVVP